MKITTNQTLIYTYVSKINSGDYKWNNISDINGLGFHYEYLLKLINPL